MKQYLLISNTTENKINNSILNYFSQKLGYSTFKEANFKELSPQKAYELEIHKEEINLELKNSIINFLSQKSIDCNFIKATKNRKKKLLLADMDSTIIQEESLDELARQIGKEKEVIREMNRVVIVVDISHSAEQSTFDAIEFSEKPIAITHANPAFWHSARRNKSSDLLKALGDSGGMLGLSLYPHHLLNGTDCTIESFCSMVARTAEVMGVQQIGIGSDLCLKQPDSVVDWMRNGTWTKTKDYGEGTASNATFPRQPTWFEDARGFVNLEAGLKTVGFNDNEIKLILGNNWFNFYKDYIN